MSKPLPYDAESALHEHDFRATPLRLALLDTLALAPKPLTASQLVRKVKRTGADTATVYRALEAFTDAGLIRKLSLFDDAHSYELIRDGVRTYHIVCDSCGMVERVPLVFRTIESAAKEKSRLFKTVDDHRLSLTGTCKKCARAVR